MINAYHAYEQWRTEHPSSGKSTKVQRDAVTTSYQAYMENYAAGDPALMKVVHRRVPHAQSRTG